jgi:nickel superoxide dismutase
MKLLKVFMPLSIVVFVAVILHAHCQIPCGIYDDRMRIDMIMESAETIEKSIKEIKKLETGKEKNTNQLVRWIQIKDEHADDIIHIAAEYFLAQRVVLTDKNDKSLYNKYIRELEIIRNIIVYAMKTKQSLDLENVRILINNVEGFREVYFKW